jgi:hypothetical protein
MKLSDIAMKPTEFRSAPLHTADTISLCRFAMPRPRAATVIFNKAQAWPVITDNFFAAA